MINHQRLLMITNSLRKKFENEWDSIHTLQQNRVPNNVICSYAQLFTNHIFREPVISLKLPSHFLLSFPLELLDQSKDTVNHLYSYFFTHRLSWSADLLLRQMELWIDSMINLIFRSSRSDLAWNCNPIEEEEGIKLSWKYDISLKDDE